MKITALKRSVNYPKYWLCRNDDGSYFVGLKDDETPGGLISVGALMDPENFETACDIADEEFRCLLNDLL